MDQDLTQAEMILKAQAAALRSQRALSAILNGIKTHLDEPFAEPLPFHIQKAVKEVEKILKEGDS